MSIHIDIYLFFMAGTLCVRKIQIRTCKKLQKKKKHKKDKISSAKKILQFLFITGVLSFYSVPL
jgi:hypothetical protein